MADVCISLDDVLAQLDGPAAPAFTSPSAAPEGADPLKPVPVQGFYLNTSRPVDDLFGYLAEQRLDMGDDALDFLRRYSHLRVVSGTQLSAEMRNLFDAFNGGVDTGTAQKLLLVGTRDAGLPTEREEVLGSLPLDRVGFPKTQDLYRFLNTRHGQRGADFEAPVSSRALQALVRQAYPEGERRMSPPQLTRQEGNSYPLEALRARYGANYPFLFSSVHVVTDTRNGRFPDRMVGRPVVFYAKFPKRGRTVDSLLALGSQNENLGYLPLDEKAGVSTVEGLLEQVALLEGADPFHRERLLLSDNVLSRLFLALYQDKTLSDKVWNTEFAAHLRQTFSGNGRAGMSVQTSAVNRRQLFDQLERIAGEPRLREAFNRAMQNREHFPHGVYISPAIFQTEALRQDSVALVHQPEQVQPLLYSRLEVSGLADNAVSAPNFDFELATDPQLRAQQLEALFSDTPEEAVYAPEAGLGVLPRPPQGPVDLTPVRMAPPHGAAVHATVSQIMRPFAADYGINARDLEEFITNELTPIIMTGNSDNFTQRLQAYFDQTTLC